MKIKKLIPVLIIIGIAAVLWTIRQCNVESGREIGDKVDSLNGVYVFYNGEVSNVSGRNRAEGGYNLGLKYQCVEFVKRYYYQHLNHKMPDSYGHAKDFFNVDLKDGQINTQRALKQFTNPSSTKPQVNDLIVMGGTLFNKYGHVVIVSDVSDSRIEIIQQNPGKRGKSRESLKLVNSDGKWKIDHSNILGWLRK